MAEEGELAAVTGVLNKKVATNKCTFKWTHIQQQPEKPSRSLQVNMWEDMTCDIICIGAVLRSQPKNATLGACEGVWGAVRPWTSRGGWLTAWEPEQEGEFGGGCWGTALWAQMSASIVGIFPSKPVVDSNTVHLFKAISNMSCLTSFKSYLTPRNSHEFTVRIKEENSQRERNYHFHFVHRRCL